MKQLKRNMEILSQSHFGKPLNSLNTKQLHYVLSKAILGGVAKVIETSNARNSKGRRAYYFSAEFLVGRAIYNNLLMVGADKEAEEILREIGTNINAFEEIEDVALGNGGLGRLAACFLDSAATLKISLDGYGIRYKYGLFKQRIDEGFQTEEVDNWQAYLDPWSIRRDEDAVRVDYTDFSLQAVPYDMPIIGYGAKHISNLRLWQAEPVTPFSFKLFNEQKYDKAVARKNRVEDISRVLYPNDSGKDGKLLRLRQQYFFSSASLKDIIKRYKREQGNNLKNLPQYVTIQLNDTHPVISIPELIRLLSIEGVGFAEALKIARDVFNYTNHTVMKEALESWDLSLLRKINSDVAKIIVKINNQQRQELNEKKIDEEVVASMQIISGGVVNMAYLASFCSSHINGVAKIHTEILKDDVLSNWYRIYPEKFSNKTNGITFRRWLALCNKGLSSLVTELLGSNRWITDANELKKLEKFCYDDEILKRFMAIRKENKEVLSEYIVKSGGVGFNTDWIVDVQIKRLHEYKRQLLNALCILELYFEIKEGALKDFTPTVFLFGAKAAPGYFRAKAIIKLINEISRLIESDPEVRQYIKVIFVENYDVSYAEKIVAAADVSEQLSLAGTEASGTGNMKLMLNGAVTLGTYDGANIEIVEAAGKDNNYIFGATVEEIEALREDYSPRELYKSDYRIKRCMDALIDGTLSDGDTLMFSELYDAILNGTSWHKPDHYYLLHDFADCLDKKLKVNKDYKDKYAFFRKCWQNIANAGRFSSDRTVLEYAKEIWKIK